MRTPLRTHSGPSPAPGVRRDERSAPGRLVDRGGHHGVVEVGDLGGVAGHDAVARRHELDRPHPSSTCSPTARRISPASPTSRRFPAPIAPRRVIISPEGTSRGPSTRPLSIAR